MEYPETIITKLTIKDKPTYITVKWENNQNNVFSIKIFYETTTWMGTFTCDAANKYRERHKETIDGYVKEVKKCLIKENPMYKYDFIIPSPTNIGNTATFSWKKLFEGSTAVIVHGSMELRQSNETIHSLIDNLLEANLKLRNDFDDSISLFTKANSEVEKYQNELIKQAKSSKEDILYSKLAHLLNAKKRRIQHLEDALNQTENC